MAFGRLGLWAAMLLLSQNLEIICRVPVKESQKGAGLGGTIHAAILRFRLPIQPAAAEILGEIERQLAEYSRHPQSWRRCFTRA